MCVTDSHTVASFQLQPSDFVILPTNPLQEETPRTASLLNPIGTVTVLTQQRLFSGFGGRQIKSMKKQRVYQVVGGNR